MKDKFVKCLEKQNLALESPLTCILLGDYFSTLEWVCGDVYVWNKKMNGFDYAGEEGF